MATREEISRYLTEKVLGKCRHELHCDGTNQEGVIIYHCSKCKTAITNVIDQYFTFSAEGIFNLIKAGREKDWWEEFEEEYILNDKGLVPFIDWPNLFNLPEVMYKFLKERE